MGITDGRKPEGAPQTGPACAPEAVIFVHGTGAADLADRGEKWWQIGSTFERALSAAVSGKAFVDRPFHWSGHNSERERRAAGKALLARLTELDQTGHS